MTSPSKRGRPTAGERVERDERIFETAAQLFVDIGFHATSVDAIAAAAGVTKRTIYERAGTKTDLLRSLVRRIHDDVAERSRGASEGSGPVESRLADACFALCSALFTDRAVGLHRAAIALVPNDLDAAREFYDAGPLEAQRVLSAHLGGDMRRAEQLFASLLGERHRRRLLGLEPEPAPDVIRQHVADVLAHTRLPGSD